LNQQLEAAILAALQTAEQSGDSTNFQTVIGNAVQQTLQANGIGGTSSTATTASSSTSSASSSNGTTNSTGSTTSTASMSSLNRQIEAAIVSALQNAQSSGASTGLQTIIGNAVQQTLQANGISADQFGQQTQSADGGMGGMNGMGGMMGMPPPPFANNPSTSNTSSASSATSSTSSTTSTASTSSLNQQLEAAILAALQTAEQSGDSTNFQTVIGSAVQQTLQANGIGGTSSTATVANSSTSSSSSVSNTSSSDSTSSSDNTGTASFDQLVQLLQQLFGDPSSSSNGQLLGLLVDTQG
jgi:hypothetical protein